MILGFDFDNTIIDYDDVFSRVAKEQELVPSSLMNGKELVRNYLRNEGREDEWTRLQGEVYGRRILEATPAENAFDIISFFFEKEISMRIVSHKTQWPYSGPRFDLHGAARGWLNKYGFCDTKGLNWPGEWIYFEETKEKKISRIMELGCTHFVDDLPEILEMLPSSVIKILYAPISVVSGSTNWLVMGAWSELPALLEIR